MHGCLPLSRAHHRALTIISEQEPPAQFLRCVWCPRATTAFISHTFLICPRRRCWREHVKVTVEGRHLHTAHGWREQQLVCVTATKSGSSCAGLTKGAREGDEDEDEDVSQHL